MAKATPISDNVAEEAIRRLLDALKKLGRGDLASLLLVQAKRGYLYVAEAGGRPVCRLRYSGKPDDWDLQMFMWSTERYDTGGDFMFGGGTLEECIGAAIDGCRL
jgi:hypothetical protein